MAIGNNVQNQNGGQANSLLTTLLSPLDYTIQTAVNTFDWVYLRLPSIPYATPIKNVVTSIGTKVVTSIGTFANTLWDPTPIVIEKIKKELPVQFNLTDTIMVKPGEDHTFILKVVKKVQDDVLKSDTNSKLSALLQNPLRRFTNSIIDKTTNPTTPNMTKEMLERCQEKIKDLKNQISINERKYNAKSFPKQAIAGPAYLATQMQAESKLAEMIKTYELNLQASQNNAPLEKASWGTTETILYKIVTTVLNQLCVEKNVGNLLSLFLKELTKVITSIQGIDLINSESIKNDFVKTLLGNININANEFEEKQKLLLRAHLEKIALNIINKVDKTNPTLFSALSALAPTKIIEKFLNGLLEVLSETILDQMLKTISCFKPNNNLNNNLELHQKILKDGVQCGPVNIQFPKATTQCLLNQDKFVSFKNNINQLMPLILHILVAVIADGLANYIDWGSDASENKMMPSDVDNNDFRNLTKLDSAIQSNFRDLISAIQSSIGMFHGMMGEALEFRRGRVELSEAIVGSYFIFDMICTFLGMGSEGSVGLLLDTGHEDEDRQKTHIKFVRAIISDIAQGTISTAVKLAGYEIKRIRIAAIIPVLTQYLGEIVKT